jgi:hypothetical protein
MKYDPKNQIPGIDQFPDGVPKCADCLLPQSEAPQGNFRNGLSKPAQNAFKNGARPAGRIRPGGPGRGR